MANVCACGCGCNNPVGQLSTGEYLRKVLSENYEIETICDYCQDPNHQQQFQSEDTDDPITILQKRYARGEITREEFLQTKEDLE